MKIVLIVFLGLVFYSCVYDKQHKLITLQNKSPNNVVVLFSKDSIINDEGLFYRSKYSVKRDSTQEIRSLNVPNDIFFVFIYNEDSVYNNIRNRVKDGIVKKSFLIRLKLSMDSLKKKNPDDAVVVFK